MQRPQEAEPRAAWPEHLENVVPPLVPISTWASQGLRQMGPSSESLDLSMGVWQWGKAPKRLDRWNSSFLVTPLRECGSLLSPPPGAPAEPATGQEHGWICLILLRQRKVELEGFGSNRPGLQSKPCPLEYLGLGFLLQRVGEGVCSLQGDPTNVTWGRIIRLRPCVLCENNLTVIFCVQAGG